MAAMSVAVTSHDWPDIRARARWEIQIGVVQLLMMMIHVRLIMMTAIQTAVPVSQIESALIHKCVAITPNAPSGTGGSASSAVSNAAAAISPITPIHPPVHLV